jgi:hypothetical protein
VPYESFLVPIVSKVPMAPNDLNGLNRLNVLNPKPTLLDLQCVMLSPRAWIMRASMLSRKFVDTTTVSFPLGAWAHVKVEVMKNIKNNLDSRFRGNDENGQRLCQGISGTQY